MPHRALPLALVLAIGTGCYAQPPSTKPNIPQRIQLEVPRDDLVRAVRELAHEQGWMLTTDQPRDGRWVAVGLAETGGGLVTRDRWIFTFEPAGIAVQRFLDFIDQGRWASTDKLCDTYAYSAEREQLTAIERRVVLRAAQSSRRPRAR